MTQSSFSNVWVTAGSTLLAAGLGLGVLSWMTAGTNKNKASTATASSSTSSALTTTTKGGNLMVDDIDDDDHNHTDDPNYYITPELVCEIFDQLFLEMQSVIAQLMQQIQAIQMAGQNIPEKQLQGILRAEMERALIVKQRHILDQKDVDYDCLEEATWEFIVDQENKNVIKVVERFQKLWEHATGQNVTGWRPGKIIDPNAIQAQAIENSLSPTRTIEVAEKYFASLTDHMRTLVMKYKIQGLNLNDSSIQQQLNMEFASGANDAGEMALEMEQVTMDQFESSIKIHANNPTVGRALGMLQMKQQQELMAMQMN